MLKDDKVDDLQRMYTLLGRVAHGHSSMRKVMGDHIKDEGKAIVEDQEMQERPLEYVQRLLDLKDKYDDILVHAMNNDKNFQHTLNQSFEFFINLNNRSPEYISLFIDDKLQKGVKGGANEEETEGILDKVMMLFRFIQEKDIFEKYYKQHLAKRLLLNRSSSDDQERNMIAKLKTECGYQFTSKLEGMFQDMKLSAQTSDGFKDYLAKNEGASNPLRGIELNVHVLTTGFWPTQSTSKCNLPPDLTKCTEIFQKYYLSNHNGRRLTWQINMGSAEMRAFFGSSSSNVKKHELNVTTFQVCVLTLYNSQDTYTFRDLHLQTQIPVPDLKRNLLALCANPTVRILKKEPAVKKFLETDTFTFNDDFKSKLFRVKLLPSTQKDSEPAREATIVKIDEDRKHMIEAAIVRVMKSRKSMQHAQLVAEVSKQLSSRFRPTPVDIKKRVESLIEREYLERSQADRKVYNYLA
jgi:cullin 3